MIREAVTERLVPMSELNDGGGWSFGVGESMNEKDLLRIT